MSESKTSERRLEAADKQARALELRKQGLTFEAIADKVGYSGPSGAYNAVMAALKRTLQEPADEVRHLELKRTDMLLERLIGRLDAPGHLPVNELRTLADSILRVMERRSKYLGLDQPFKVAPTDPTGDFEYTGASDSEAVREFMELVFSREEKAADEEGARTELSLDAESET